jgi:hypothetical protein
MKIQSIILLIVSIMFVISSSWNLSIFLKLNNDSKISNRYKKNGKILSVIIFIISIILLISSSANIYYNY